MGIIMGSINEIKCNNCDFSVNTSDNFIMMVCDKNLDYYNELYCVDCEKIVKVGNVKMAKRPFKSVLNVDHLMFF